ncbi:hypothetical protein METBIDRAFT_12158 [Metschnikowia bicuspidata var. bicuspidata NRRL YB-4993]|uniref:Uncharacterized protein n=1 Tax=Metschnikowia bicuspidata var. bicuspidata NRRL YB-4993 TaxID=869754 RepID=A0A1A0HCN9_9ASCO|nr:hypothetical protein METBIDRAFT_12158 [Metschnikowia bicuspidata var. bicuspidata NRRL YB-4993]OBA21678.1 hypothetical protein METBIDRAFT_12158 [Metschnikowia bicuspidata var. bicuspidata NRRL YB-4993]
MVSTGRGGSGNIVSPEEVREERPEVPHEHKSDKRIYYSTGRGGSGNIKSSSEMPSPKLVPQGTNTPKLTTSKVTTGRGGYGNMVDNDDPNLTRKLQDVDGNKAENELLAVASNKSFAIGRGGFGNVVSKTRSNGSSAGSNPNNLYTVVSQGEKTSQKKGNFMLKVKNLFS